MGGFGMNNPMGGFGRKKVGEDRKSHTRLKLRVFSVKPAAISTTASTMD